jgi:hypothetical protein
MRASDELMVRLGKNRCLYVNKPGFFSPHTLTLKLLGIMGWSSTAASIRILPASLLLLLLSPVGLAGQTTSNYSDLPQVSLTVSKETADLTEKQEPKCPLRHVTTSQVANLATTYDILTIILQPSARHVSTACCQHSLAASMVSVASTMVNVNVHRDGLESIA